MLFITRQLTVTLMRSYQNHKIFCKGNSEFIIQINVYPYLLYMYLYIKNQNQNAAAGKKSEEFRKESDTGPYQVCYYISYIFLVAVKL